MVEVRALGPDDRALVVGLLRTRWGSERMVANDAVFRPADHPGFLATMEGEPAGVLTYRIDGDQCEVTLLDTLEERQGVGTALLSAVARVAKAAAAPVCGSSQPTTTSTRSVSTSGGASVWSPFGR